MKKTLLTSSLMFVLISATLAGPSFSEAAIVFDDMEHGDPSANGWFTFGGSVGGGSLGANSTDLPPSDGGAFSLQTGWGSSGVRGFFGGFGRTNPVDLSGTDHFNFWINPDAGQEYTLEINLQDDDNGDDQAVPADDDEFQYNCVISPSGPCVISGGGWQRISIPLADFFDDNSFFTGGNGVFDAVAVPNGGNGRLINVVIAVIGDSGSDATFRTDYWAFSDGPLAEPTQIVDDFETGLPSGVDGNGTPIGFYTFSDGSQISIATTSAPPAPVPGAGAGNNVLQMDVDAAAFAGVIHGFENAAVDTWTTQDWSAYEELSIWVYGINSGTDLFIDILDNRNPGSTADDAERFTVTFVDEFNGWQLIEFPFSSFVRKEIGNGAPNDGITLTEVNGWALGTLATPGPVTFYIDNVQLQASFTVDSDGDGTPDNDDLCPGTASGGAVDSNGCADEQVDGDGDGACDPGAPSGGPSGCTGSDDLPDNPNESSDNDGDGTGDNADTDDDNDGQLDTDEIACGSDPLDSGSVSRDADNDGTPDCVDSDDDNDGVDDSIDQCASTVIPESVPTSSRGLGSNRWTLYNADGSFTQGSPQSGRTLSFTTKDTKGCSCEQIIAELGLGEGHSKFGCSNSAMMDWINRQ